MIISVSRRTDIPALYSDWFFNRIKEKVVYKVNPFNNQVKEVSLHEDDVTIFVFWTKNPKPMFERLDELKNYHYYFHITLNNYGLEIEPNGNDIASVIELSKRIGSRKIIWRYDPIIITEKYDLEWHKNNFDFLASKLHPFVNRCTFSFVQPYKNTLRNLEFKNIDRFEIAKELVKICKKYQLKLETCAVSDDFSSLGINKTHCIDKQLIEEIIGKPVPFKKDKYQRKECGCIESVDIGVYNTCTLNCSYCYANYNSALVKANLKKYNLNSKALCKEKF